MAATVEQNRPLDSVTGLQSDLVLGSGFMWTVEDDCCAIIQISLAHLARQTATQNSAKWRPDTARRHRPSRSNVVVAVAGVVANAGQ